MPQKHDAPGRTAGGIVNELRHRVTREPLGITVMPDSVTV